MRDLILLMALLGVAPLIVRAPIVGLLAWIWITLMNPQREVYGILGGFGLNLYVAVLTVLAWFFCRERKAPALNLVTVSLVLFAAWTTLTTFDALDPTVSFPVWDATIKSLFLGFAVATLANTRERLQAVVWMIVVALGYYAIKGGLFVLATGGRYHVVGPAYSMISDNNAFGLALLMVLPLLNYLRRTSRLAFMRIASLGTIGLTLLAVVGTYSRGALLALVAGLGAYAIRSRTGVLVLLVCLVTASSVVSFLPPAWLERMSTIQSYEADDSFNGRVQAWKMNTAIALERPLVGGGFYAGNVEWIARRYSGGVLTRPKAAHSIYFEVLGDHGFVGLGIFLLLIAGAWLNTWRVLGQTRGRPELSWAAELARMLQISLVVFLVGGAALSMAYYDGALVLMALTASLLEVVRRPATAGAAVAAAPKWKALPEPEAAAEAAVI